MSPEEIILEVHRLRDEIESRSRRVVELSQTLYNQVRRQPDDYTSRFVVFANTWVRFGSMVEGGIRRTGTTTRLIEGVRKEIREAKEQADAVKAKPKPERRQDHLSSLVELYGEEMVSDAAAW
jgi:hypothetical protein